MRIALVGPVYPLRSGDFLSILANTLAERDEVLVVSWKRQYPRRLYPGGEQLDAEVAFPIHADVRFLLDYRSPTSWLRAVDLLRRWRSDAVVFNWITPFVTPVYLTLAGLLRRLRRRPVLVALCHNVVPHEARAFDRAATRAVLGRMDACIVHSSTELPALREVAPRAPSRTLFLPEYGALTAGAGEPADLRSELGLGPRVLLFFGYVRPYKGLQQLLEAMPAVLRRLDVDLLIAGEFWYDQADKTRATITRLGLEPHVTIVDSYIPVPRVRDFLNAGDVVVLPYTDATQSGIVQLAYGAGKPVVATRVGGLSEAVVDGETGLLVPPGDTGALADAIVRFYDGDTALRLAEGVARQRERFSWHRYAEALRELVGGTGPVRAEVGEV